MNESEGILSIKVTFEEQQKAVIAKTTLEVHYPSTTITEKYINDRSQLILQQAQSLMDNALGVSKRFTDLKQK